MEVTQLVAKDLRLSSYTTGKPEASLNGITTVELESDGQHFRVYLVRDANHDNVTLEEGAKLAAFYNSKFFHETVAIEQINIPSGRFRTFFKIEDVDADHSLFVLQFDKGHKKAQLSLDELIQVAERLADLHAVNTSNMTKEFLTAVRENHVNISKQQRELSLRVIHIMRDSLHGEMSKYFRHPEAIYSNLQILLRAQKDEEDEEIEGNSVKNLVICHGHLTADECSFDDNNQLVEISDWEHVHFGDPALDLSQLIVSSSEPTVRRNHFMKVFRHYFYLLVDKRAPKFKLQDLKDLFIKHRRNIVIGNVEHLLETLSTCDNEHVRHGEAERWESALQDAVDYETGNYISDDEHCFFN